MGNRIYTYIAGDWDHDKDAVEVLEYWNNTPSYNLFYLDVHKTKSARDESLNCTIKQSLKDRLNISKRFVLIVGEQTNTVTKGGCQLCGSYNSWTQHCARGYSIDYDSFIKYECKNADLSYWKKEMSILVLYKSTMVNKDLCPDAVRYDGIHIPMIKRDWKGELFWDYKAVEKAFANT